jgi:hypothetical protein
MDKTELCALALYGRDQGLAPSPKPNYGGVDHRGIAPGVSAGSAEGSGVANFGQSR